MKLEVIDTHTVATDLLSGRPILDAGCRGFGFAKWFVDKGHKVIAIDPAPDVKEPDWMQGASCFLNEALVGMNHSELSAQLVLTDDGAACHIDATGTRLVPCVQIEEYADTVSESGWDVVKLDIEGSEYDVLATWLGPVARQISVEFHEHTSRKRGKDGIAKIVEHLGKWYEPVQHEWTDQMCAGFNYWDSLFVLRELL